MLELYLRFALSALHVLPAADRAVTLVFTSGSVKCVELVG